MLYEYYMVIIGLAIRDKNPTFNQFEGILMEEVET